MMVWVGNTEYRLAPAVATLLRQLEAQHPGQGWLDSPQTGTLGDTRHMEEGDKSDHVPWLNKTVRAVDIAANVSGVPGIVTVSDAPDCEALFAMANRMYAAKDPRMWPNGYAIYLRRITDWNNPGGFHAQVGDPHLYHLHISVSQNPAGFNSTAPWPLAGPVDEPTSSAGPPVHLLPASEDELILVRRKSTPAVVGLLTTKGIAVLQDADTVHSLRDSGVTVAKNPIGDRDFDSLVRWGRL